MKICVALHSCMDLGGIINHTEQLIGGLKDLGHEVDLFELVYADRVGSQNKTGHFEIGPSGIPYDQGKGWNWPIRNRLPYKTNAALNITVQVLSEYDLVIWTVPVVPKNKQHLGNHRWPDLYDLPPTTKQVAFIHDGNCKQGAPHLYQVADKLSGLACVHACALNGADHLPIPRALVVNPQKEVFKSIVDWDDRHTGFINMQTFKAWKHTHDLVKAIAYMPQREMGELREVAGKGIEYQYMTSIDKCKEAYFHDDPEQFFHSLKIWDTAVFNGMTHHGYWPTKEAENWLQMSRVLVDPSWSKKYSQVGGHWNRVVVEAMIHGAIPVAQEKGMGRELFLAGEHYVDLGAARDSQDYADIILHTSNLSTLEARRYQDNAHDIIGMFCRSVVAQRVVDLAYGNIETQTGVTDDKIWSKYEDLMFNQYGVLV